jgi:hypothetical protein
MHQVVHLSKDKSTSSKINIIVVVELTGIILLVIYVEHSVIENFE